MNDIEAGLISLDRPGPRPDDIDARYARRRGGMSRLLAWGLAAMVAGAVAVAADRVRHRPDDLTPAPIVPARPDPRGMPATIVTHRQAVAGERITVVVAGAVLGTRHEGWCGFVELRFDARPIHHSAQYVLLDPSEPDVTSTATMTVPADATTGEHTIALYAPFPGIPAGLGCTEEASIAAVSIAVVAAR
jgi:hypothetical protein